MLGPFAENNEILQIFCENLRFQLHSDLHLHMHLHLHLQGPTSQTKFAVLFYEKQTESWHFIGKHQMPLNLSKTLQTGRARLAR